MTERCQVCGRETAHVVSIYRREGRAWRSRYACAECDALWLASFGQPEPEDPPEIDRAQLMFRFEGMSYG